jgi:TolB-like protein
VAPADQQAFQFGPFRLDGHCRSLTRDGALVLVGGRALDILLVLARAAGQTVGKATLLEQVWPGLTVEENNLQVHISALRKTLGEGRIMTVPGRGYRLLLRSDKGRAFETDTNRLLEWPALPEKPSIAVLPFSNMSGDPDQEYFVDGVVEEITTALSRIRWLFVIARNSSFTYKGKNVDVRRVGRELGVHYLLEGSVRKAGRRARISGQLIDAQTGMHLWADHFDSPMDDMFELQDRVAISIAGVIEPALQAAETHRTAVRPTTELGAYDLYLRALATFFPVRKEGLFGALALLEQAIAFDPRYGPALCWAAVCHLRLVRDSWADEPEKHRREAIDLARRALQVGENDPVVLANAAEVLAGFGEDINAMIGLVDRALALNPSYARGWFLSCMLRTWAGQPDLAMEHLATSLRLSPLERSVTPMLAMGSVYFFKRIKSFRIAKPRRKLRWTERGRDAALWPMDFSDRTWCVGRRNTNVNRSEPPGDCRHRVSQTEQLTGDGACSGPSSRSEASVG